MLALLHPRASQEVQTNSTEHSTFAAKLRLHVEPTRLHTDKMVRPQLAISYSPWPDGDEQRRIEVRNSSGQKQSTRRSRDRSTIAKIFYDFLAHVKKCYCVCMQVTLTKELEALIKSKVQSGRYVDESDVVRDALRALEQREQYEDPALETALLDGVRSPHRAYNKGTLDRIRRGARRK